MKPPSLISPPPPPFQRKKLKVIKPPLSERPAAHTQQKLTQVGGVSTLSVENHTYYAVN